MFRAHALLCPALCNPMDGSLPGFSAQGIVQAGILERVAISSSTGSSPPRDRGFVSCISCIGRQRDKQIVDKEEIRERLQAMQGLLLEVSLYLLQ